MVFNGLQKMTLLDFPGRVACTIFTLGCNLRCPFCHNALLVTGGDNPEFSEEEILKFLSKRVGLLDGVCITGGEPLMHKDIDQFIKKVKELGFSVKLDTNGFYPEHLNSLIENNLVDYVAIDIKNSFEKYAITTGIKNVDTDKVKESIEILDNSNVPHEFRTTVVKELHEVEDIEKISKMIKRTTPYFLQNFVDSGNLIGENLSAWDKGTLNTMCSVSKANLDKVEIRGID